MKKNVKQIIKSSISISLAATLALAPCSAYAMTQDETVYVKMQPSGATEQISVTKHLINDLKDVRLNDKSILENIENLNGYEEFTTDGESVTWQANGADIYYRGLAKKALPVKVEISYALDGQEKNVEEMLGKAGKVEIRLELTNLAKVGDLYTPFAAAVATILPEKEVSNVAVTNGKATSNGKSVVVAAVAAPGLYDSLKLDELETMDEVTISYETESFALQDLYIIVTPEILNGEDLKTFTQLDQLYADMQTLSDSSKQLADGSAKLQDGVQSLRDAIAEAKTKLSFDDGLLDGKPLDQIASMAASAATQQVRAQQASIRAQIHQQVSNMPELKQLQQQLTLLVEPLAKAQAIELCMKDAAAVSKPVTPEAGTGEGIGSNADADVDSEDTSDTSDAGSSAETPAAPTAPTINCNDAATLQKYIAAVLPEVQKQLTSGLNISAMEEKLFQSTYAAMQQVAQQTAATTARSVAAKVADSIQEGLGDNLVMMLDQVLDGVDALLDGAKELNSGMKKFDAEGIQKLNDLVNNKVKVTSDKVERLVKLSDSYNNYSGIGDNTEGKLKFVMMVEGREAE